MFKRLFVAAIITGLVAGFDSTALGDVPGGKAAATPLTPNIMSPERSAALHHAGPTQPSFRKPTDAFRPLVAGFSTPQLRQGYFCDVQDYTSGTPAYAWSIPNGYGDDLLNMRFTSEWNFNCSLKVASFLMYAYYQTGNPSMEVYLWDDDGFGFPGNKLDSITIAAPGAGLAGTNVNYWVSADFSSADWVFSDGEQYHLGFTTLADSPDDSLWLVSDAADGPFAGETRASEFYNGGWGTMLNDWGDDVSFFILAERCCSEMPYSDCHTRSYYANVDRFWRIPEPTYGDLEYTERFDVDGPETLTSVDIGLYNDSGSSSAFDAFGNNDVYVKIYDDSAGLPGAQLASVALAAGSYPQYPALTNVPIPGNLVVTHDFHVGISTSGIQGTSYECLLSSDGTDGGARSSVYADTTNFDGTGMYGWQSMAEDWGPDVQFCIAATLCKDPYSDCSNNSCYTSPAYIFHIPDAYGDSAQAMKFTGYFEGCRVQDVNLFLFWHRLDYQLPLYSTPTNIKVLADAGGMPGDELASITVNPGDYGITPPTDTFTSHTAWLTVDFQPLNVIVYGSYWIAIENTGAPGTGIEVLSDAGGGPCLDNWDVYHDGSLEAPAGWRTMQYWYGVGDDWALFLESEHCCFPAPPPCPPPFEWSTYQGTQARTGASYVEMGDSWCDLTLNWHFEHPSQGVSFTGPVVYKDRVICSFTTEYRVFDIDGTPLYTYVPQQGPFAAGDVRCAPTVTTITGYPNPVFFAAGGSNQEVSCVDLTDGSVVWSRNVNSVGPAGLFGAVRYGTFTVLNLGGTDYVFWGTDNGKVVGVDALTGALMAGYPVDLTLSTWVSGATDGTSLFYSTGGTAVEGDIYSIDAATGAINWQLSSSGGLQGASVWSDYRGDEGFTGGVAYDVQRNYLYANSRVSSGDYPADGLFYRIKANDGSLAGPVTLANRNLYGTPVVDANRVYVTSFSRWTPPPAGGDIYAVNSATGTIDWAHPGGPEAFPYYCSGVLSCERYAIGRQLFVFGYDGFMSCLNAETGAERWRRRAEAPAPGYNERGMAGALAVDSDGDSHLLYADLCGNLFDLTKQADRPRLEFQSYDVSAPVEFGPATSYIVRVPHVFANTGCADLDITSVAIDQTDYGVDVPAFSASNVDNVTFNRMASIADRIAGENSLIKALPARIRLDDDAAALSVRSSTTRRQVDRTAAGFPPFMNAIIHPAVGDVISPKDTMDLIMDVIQANIHRGPQDFYLQLGTNDPDFFLNDPSLLPQMHITIVGGCLVDTTTLDFGTGGTNSEWVTNTGRLATGDWDPYGFDIDGDGVSYYQGSYVWAVSPHRIATNSQAWTGGGEAESFVSMQPDPNWCDNDCKPFLDAGVTLGYASADGLTYTPITGNMICKSFLDSVQNFDLGDGWNWKNWGAPFDNDSTMGLYATSKTVGAVDAPAPVATLNNLTLEMISITERNGNDVPGWYMGEFWDCDLGHDHIAIDRSISTAWVYNGSDPTYCWGQIKVPFGCGEEPIINTFETWGNSTTHHGFWDWSQYWDTCYTMLTSSPGAYYFVPNGDEEAHVTFASHDFAPNETYKIGIAHFALFGLTDASTSAEFAPMASIVNKWAGFGRGDVNNDGVINAADIIYLAGTVNGGPGAIPFQHLSDVNNDGAIDMADVQYLIDYYFNCGPCPTGDFVF